MSKDTFMMPMPEPQAAEEWAMDCDHILELDDLPSAMCINCARAYAAQECTALRATLTEAQRELDSYKGTEGRCPVGHNKRFTYDEEIGKGCVACERDALQQRVEALKKTVIFLSPGSHDINCNWQSEFEDAEKGCSQCVAEAALRGVVSVDSAEENWG